jgi:hypothetical protein
LAGFILAGNCSIHCNTLSYSIYLEEFTRDTPAGGVLLDYTADTKVWRAFFWRETAQYCNTLPYSIYLEEFKRDTPAGGVLLDYTADTKVWRAFF